MKTKKIFNSVISVGEYRSFVDKIIFYAHSKIPSYVCFANVHMVVEAYRDKSFQKLVNEADLLLPDGKPLSVFLKLSEGINQDRVCGMDILPDLLRQAEESGASIYFYGSTEELLRAIVQKAQTEFPKIKIAGYYSPPFRDLTREEDETITEKIRQTHPDLVFVSLGCPKQEKWMAAHKTKLNACLLGLGQAFKVYAGVEKRLPLWMRNLSLEWVFRLYLEPRRLWKRYLYTNSIFLFLAVKYLVIGFFQKHRHEVPGKQSIA